MQIKLPEKSKYHQVDPTSLSFKFFLVYDIFMVFIIIFNLFCLCANFFLMSSIGAWFFEHIHLSSFITFYKEHLHSVVITSEAWFIGFLITEFLVRWINAIIKKHHSRWFFFPFIHWYEILAIVPQFRFLRLFRAGIIAYRLHELGYQIIPKSWIKQGHFYYQVLMEELSDRVVISVIDGIKRELETSSTHKRIVHELVDHHRQLFAITLAEILQENLAHELNIQHDQISKSVGQIVNKAIEDTPELRQLLRLIPLVGGRIEQQIQSIGQRLGENISSGLLQPFSQTAAHPFSPNYELIAKRVSEINIENKSLEKLVESIVFESLQAIRDQVKIKQWQEILKQREQAKD